MPSKAEKQEIQTYRIGTEASPEAMLMALAETHGIHPEVGELLRNPPPGTMQGVRVPPLGQLLKRHRLAYNLKMRQIHVRSGISRSQLSFYESGESKNPGLRTIQALSYGYRIPFIRVLLSSLVDIHPRMTVKKRVR